MIKKNELPNDVESLKKLVLKLLENIDQLEAQNSELKLNLQHGYETQASGNSKKAKQSESQISIEELQKILNNPHTTEADIASYFIPSPYSSSMDPVFILNPDFIIPSEREGAQLVNWLNGFMKMYRRNQYFSKIKSPKVKTRIISEGDSWFQYPLLLKDVIDCLMDEEDYAILSFGTAGAHLTNMVGDAEFLQDLRIEDPDIFLISAGGNDLVGNSGIANLLVKKEGVNPQEYLDKLALKSFKNKIESQYNALFNLIISEKPTIHIICHGYSYPIPNSGVWLGKPMKEIGITDENLQKKIMAIIFDELSDSIQNVVDKHPKNIHYLNVKDVVPTNGWFDELHPNNEYYKNVANVFKAKIDSITRAKP